MNLLENLQDQDLINGAEKLAEVERTSVKELLLYLKEIDHRRLYADLGYTSLFDFVSRHLKFPEDQAYRRISVMRLMLDVPGLEEKLASGDLSLTNMTVAQSLFRKVEREGRAFNLEQKQEFLQKIEGKSTREAEREAARIVPGGIKADSMRSISESHVEMRCSISFEASQKIQLIKSLMAHSHPGMSTGQLIDLLCDLQIQNLERKNSPAAPRKKRKRSWRSIRKMIWKRDGGQCKQCGSKHALQVDHIEPKAKGGTDEPSNLRLLCRNCNQRAAIKWYGLEKMDKYLRTLPVGHRQTNDAGP